MSSTSRVKSTGLGLVIILVNVLIVALVAIGFSQRGFTGWWQTARGDWSVPQVEDPYAEDEVDPTSPPDDDMATSGPTDDAESTDEPTEEPTEEPEESLTLAERFAEEEDLTVLVLGDRTGAHPNDWVAALARDLSTERQIELVNTTPQDALLYGPVETLGEGPATISIWNSSMYGGTAGYVAQELSVLTPPQEPDVVLFNFGRANTPEDLPEQLDALWEATGELIPEAERYVVVQPPRRDGLPPTTEATREWAQDVDAPLVDIAEDFEAADLLDVTVSTRDPLSVNIFGGERWAQIVRDGLFGSQGS